MFLETDKLFRGEIINSELVLIDKTSSTNDVALDLGAQGYPEGTVIIADEQTKGRGRLGRSWISPPGVNLYFTVILRPSMESKYFPLLTLASGTAVASAIHSNTGLKAELKWPNDILVNMKKTGGILVESRFTGRYLIVVAAGVGVNVNMAISAIPEDIRPITTSLKQEKGAEIERVNLLSNILSDMERTYKILLKGDKRALITEWLRLNCTIGKEIHIQSENNVFSGIAESLNQDGELNVKLSSGETITVNAGDVTLSNSVDT